jgi:hypothetical protein
MTDANVTAPVDPNARFCVMDFSIKTRRVRIYLLNPGDCFQGFGGSSSGLVVRKTASLIVRDVDNWGCEDTEYDINKADVWGRILNAYRGSLEEAGK